MFSICRIHGWATVQVGGGRTVSEVAAELDCDWHTVNDAVTTYGEALLAADRKRLNQTSAIGLGETSFVRMGPKKRTSFATAVADVEHHQIIDILPTRKYTDVAGWIDAQPAARKERIRFGVLDMSVSYAAVYTVVLPKAAQVVGPFMPSRSPIAPSTPCAAGSRPNRPDTGAEKTTRSIGPAGPYSWVKRGSMNDLTQRRQRDA
jgi:Transposase